MRRLPILIFSCIFSLVPGITFGVAPTIQITNVPPYAVNGSISGVVTDVDFATHRVAVYIQIEGLGWWTKPTLAAPSVLINPDGTFVANVATGGLDNRATIFCAALIADGVIPPPAEAASRIPPDLESLTIDCMERYGRILEFAGFTWAVKEAPLPVGPGQNRFSDRPQDVFVDSDGLHLSINFHDGFWRATEVILLDDLGYGTYAFQTNSEVDDLDVNATFGAFTWDAYGDETSVPNALHREIDFEDSRWGNPVDITNAQVVVQPASVPGNLHRYALPDLDIDSALTRFFTWEPERIEFVAFLGHHIPCHFPPDSLIDKYLYTVDPALNDFIPTEGRERFRFNLWLNNVELGGPPPPQPADGLNVEVIITDFSFRSASDADNDKVVDDRDNCTAISNSDQRDTDNDGFGDPCDADLNNDGVANSGDLGLFAGELGTSNCNGTSCLGDVDLDGDVDGKDLGILAVIGPLTLGPSCLL